MKKDISDRKSITLSLDLIVKFIKNGALSYNHHPREEASAVFQSHGLGRPIELSHLF